MLNAALTLQSDCPEVALGVAELGQEELGKSLSFLAAFVLPDKEASWAWFWSAWKDHRKKAYRAHLYELIHPRRIELLGNEGGLHSGLPLRASIPEEKEFSLYVNLDLKSGRFVSPEESVSKLELFNRLFALLNLGVTARRVQAALTAQDSDFRLRAFSEIAFRICSESLFQQDMPAVLLEFEARSARHASLVADLRTQLKAGDSFIASILAGSPKPGDLPQLPLE